MIEFVLGIVTGMVLVVLLSVMMVSGRASEREREMLESQSENK